MPCYNAAPYVGEAIASVLRQTYQHTEIIVIDDGSQDTSPDIVGGLAKIHPDRIHLKHQNHLGPYPARNLGLRYARGDFIAFLDADDWWRDDCLEKLLTALQQSHADLTYCGWQNTGEHAPSEEPYIPPAYETADLAATFLKNCPWPIHAALIRRTVIEAVGGFSERHFSSLDYDLWLRILAHTTNILRVPEVMAFYRWHGSDQISSTKWRQVLDAVQVRRDFVTRFPEMVAHLSSEKINELIYGQLLNEAYRSYWKRDLANAQKLFRAAFTARIWHAKDLKYLLPAILPTRLFQGLVGLIDKPRGIGQ
ncbi:MAG: glycosyltransferase family 2 protein [Gammaproteobacteria bacterium]|nr:glycosyltransferase family 2 protein [Gammaproteobacteria bacterium]